MRKRGSSQDHIYFVLIIFIFLLVIGIFIDKDIKRSPSNPPTFHEFYGAIACENNQQILNGFNIIARLGGVDFVDSIENGSYHLFVENGINGQIIDFQIDNEDVEDSIFQQFGFSQKSFIVSNIYCSTQPGISINYPSSDQQITQNNLIISFTNLNFNIGGIGETHLHFYLDNDPIPYMFYNGNTNAVQYNGLTATNIERLDINSFRINNLADGDHSIRLILANIDHSELLNIEARDSISFSINTQVAQGSQGGGSSGGGGGGGGGSRSKVQCNDGIDNDNDTKKDYPNDPGCSNRLDDNEVDPIQVIYRCNDGIDNDLDNLIDLNDLGCVNSNDNSEENAIVNETTNNETRLPLIPNNYDFRDIKNSIAVIIVILIIIASIIFILYFKFNVFKRKS